MTKVHSILAALVLVALAMVIFNAIMSLKKQEKFKAGDRKLGLIGLMVTHTQFLIGLITYFVSAMGYSNLKNNGMKVIMSDAPSRLIAVEHPFMMVIAIVLITIGWSRHKRMGDAEHAKKFKSFAIFYGLGFVLILSRIPWGQWF